MRRAIICVDDEKSILWGLQQQIRRAFPDDFQIELAESGAEALEILDELKAGNTDVFLVITDEMMPGIKGHMLIKELNTSFPSTKCILLSGYTAEDISAFPFTGLNFKLLKKPWDYQELVSSIREAM